MSGKLFAASSGILEDQAQILFEHYRQIAESIVEQEEGLEQRIRAAQELQAQLRAQVRTLGTRALVSCGLGLLLGLILAAAAWQSAPFLGLLGLAPMGYGLVCWRSRKETEGRIGEVVQEIQGFQVAHRGIRRDYKVHRLGVAYVPVASKVAFEGRQFIVDHTDTAQGMEFRLNSVRQGELFAQSVNELQDLLQGVPLVEKATEVEEIATDHYSRSIQNIPMYDYLGKLDRNLRTTAYCLEDLATHSVKLPIVLPGSAHAEMLAEYGTSRVEDAVVFRLFDEQRYDSEVAAFHSLNQMKKALERHSEQFELVLRNLMVNVAETVQAVTQLKMASTQQLVDRSNRLLFTILKAPYNHYSPRLEAEEIERIRSESFDYQESVDSYEPFQLKASSRVQFDPVSEVWVAEDGSKTAFPFGMPQIHE